MENKILAIVAAMDDEIRSVKSKIEMDSRIHVRPSQIIIGKYNDKPVILARSGIGREAMRKAISYLIENHRPDFCLHVGYCGGADPRFAAGDLVIVDRVLDESGSEKIDLEPRYVESAIKICNEDGIRGKAGSVVTVALPVSGSHDKAYTGTKFEAVGIDMESYDLAAACTGHSLPFMIVRAVLDPLDLALPLFGDAVTDSGDLDPVAMAGELVKNPKQILKMPRLQYCAMQARQSIAAFIDSWQRRDIW